MRRGLNIATGIAVAFGLMSQTVCAQPQKAISFSETVFRLQSFIFPNENLKVFCGPGKRFAEQAVFENDFNSARAIVVDNANGLLGREILGGFPVGGTYVFDRGAAYTVTVSGKKIDLKPAQSVNRLDTFTEFQRKCAALNNSDFSAFPDLQGAQRGPIVEKSLPVPVDTRRRPSQSHPAPRRVVASRQP